jgi:hypothetical protein
MVLYRMFMTTIKLSFFFYALGETVNFVSNDWLTIMIVSSIAEMALSIKTGFYSSGVIVME